MNDSLLNELSTYATDAKELVGLCKNNEQQTKNSLVEPYIRLLGFDPSDARQVRVEYQTATVRAADRVDYALMEGNRPIVFVEAKSLSNKDVSNQVPMNKQLRSYMLDSASVKFGALTDGQSWMWYYKEDNQVEPVLFLDVDVLAGSQDESVVEWISLLERRAPVKEMLNGARSLSLASRIKKWFVDPCRNPSDSLARLLLKEIGESTGGRVRLDRCKRGWKRAMRDLSYYSPPVAPPPVVWPPPKHGPHLGKTCVIHYSNGKQETFKHATRLLLGIVRYCADQHNRGKQDYYDRINQPLSGTGKWSAWVAENELETLSNPTRNYSSKSVDGYRVFRNLSNQRKVLMIQALLDECILKSGDSPQIGRQLQIHLPNTSLRITDLGTED